MANTQPPDKPGWPLDLLQQPLPWWRYLAWFFVLVIFSWYFLNTESDGQQTLSYSEFKISVVEDQVARVRLQGDHVAGEFHQPLTSSTDGDNKEHLLSSANIK